MVIPSAADDDTRWAFVYPEALRGLLQQRAAADSLHARAATLIFAASFEGSLLGARALADGLGAWDWIALCMLVALCCLAVFLLWAYYNLTFPLRTPRIPSPMTSVSQSRRRGTQ